MPGRTHNFSTAKQRPGPPLPQPCRSPQGFPKSCPWQQESWMTQTGQSEPGQPLPQPHSALEAPDSLKLHPMMITSAWDDLQDIWASPQQQHRAVKLDLPHVSGRVAVFMLWLQESDRLNSNSFDISHSYSVFHQINFKALSRTPLQMIYPFHRHAAWPRGSPAACPRHWKSC